MRHVVDFRNTSDTGEIDAAAIVPYNDGEAANQTTFRRPVENTRTRTEVLRSLIREHMVLRDVERSGVLLSGGGLITFNGTVAGGGGGDGKFTLGGSLYVVPRLTAGDGVGSTAPYVASTPGVLKVGTAGNNQVIITSVLKQFEGSDLAKGDVNRLSVEILNDTAESIALEGASGDVNNVKIKIISGTTTAQNLVDLINNDVTVTQFVTAALEGTSTGTNNAALWGPSEWGSDYSLRFLSGGFPGIAHEINAGNLASFFSAHAENPLQKGDTLAISYDALYEDGGIGGMLQSTPENSNTLIGPGSLFNTRREPEKCINAIPVCKCVDDDNIIFSDGSYITKGTPARLLFDSGSAIGTALYATIDTSPWARLDIAPGAHTPPGNIQEAFNNTDDLFDSVMTEVEGARNSTIYGAQASIDARLELGDTEVYDARSGSVFGAKSSLDARIEAIETHAATVVTVSFTAGKMYGGSTALYDAINDYKDIGATIVVDPHINYTFSGNLTLTKPIHIIGKGDGQNNPVVMNLGTNTITVGSGALFARNTIFEKMRITGSLTTPQITFAAPYCAIKRCDIQCHVELIDGADDFVLSDCFVETALHPVFTASFQTYRMRISRCYIRCTDAGDYAMVDLDGNDHVIEQCEIRALAGNYFDIVGCFNLALNDCEVIAQMSGTTASPLLYLNSDSSARHLRIWGTGTSFIQPALFIRDSRADNVHIDLSGNEVRLDSEGYPLVRVWGASGDRVTALTDFTIKNFKLPFDTEALNITRPLVLGDSSGEDNPVRISHGFIGDIDHLAASGNMNCTILGALTGSTGPVTFDDVTVDTTGVTYATGTRYVFGNLANNCTIRNCKIVGTGLFTKAIDASILDNLRILNNDIHITGAWANAVHAYRVSNVDFRGNKTYFTGGAITGHIYWFQGDPGYLYFSQNNFSHNTIIKTDIGTWSTAEGMYLYRQHSSMVFGNIIYNIGINGIDYDDSLFMIPAEASLGTYNRL